MLHVSSKKEHMDVSKNEEWIKNYEEECGINFKDFGKYLQRTIFIIHYNNNFKTDNTFSRDVIFHLINEPLKLNQIFK